MNKRSGYDPRLDMTLTSYAVRAGNSVLGICVKHPTTRRKLARAVQKLRRAANKARKEAL